MTQYRSFLAAAVALATGTAAVGVAPAHAQLGTGDSAIGAGGEAVGAALSSNGTEAESAAAPRTTGGCTTNKTEFRTQSNLVEKVWNGFSGFSTMPNTHLPVTHAAGCLIVDFSGDMTLLGANPPTFIRALIAGVGAAEPSWASVGTPATPGNMMVRSARFVFPNVPAGTHTVRIEWSVIASGTVRAERRTLTVQHR